MAFEIRAEPFAGAVAQRLVAEIQQEYVARYGDPDRSPIDHEEFTPPRGTFLVGYLDGRPVCSGGIRLHGKNDAEVKRMYVVPDARGRGLARAMLARLEEVAGALGASRVILETGNRQPEAIALYESSGYLPIPGYGYYRCEPLSVCYAKPLSHIRAS